MGDEPVSTNAAMSISPADTTPEKVNASGANHMPPLSPEEATTSSNGTNGNKTAISIAAEDKEEPTIEEANASDVTIITDRAPMSISPQDKQIQQKHQMHQVQQ